jgi:HemY protein
VKVLIIIIATLIGAISAALVAKKYPGYVLVDVNGWTLESTLVLALVVLILTFTLMFYTLRVFRNVWDMPSDLKRWQQMRQTHKSHASLTNGLIELAEGKWSAAEKNLLRYARIGQASLLNYLAAARAAQEQGAYERRDLYLKNAAQDMPSADIAIGLTQAELQLNQQQLEHALATLRRLQQLSPKHKQVLKTLARLYAELGDWQNLKDMLPSLRKRKVHAETKISQMEQTAYMQLLGVAAQESGNALQSAWQNTPKSLQENAEVLTHYIQLSLKPPLKHDENDQIEPLIRKALKKNWNDRLVYYYGVVTGTDINSQLIYAETWLANQENNPAVLLTLGRLCLRARLWGKARGYLEACIGAAGSPEAYNELGNLLEQLGEPDEALKCYRAGLKNTPECHTVVPVNITANELSAPQSNIGELVKASSG